ncbi:hemerythrin domain-containing protein [Terrabacter sp. MAHUQ-38]|uniref:hemerythrin domain-containing protein n=1 Tax=unclassified Terrabacter TaxID=2630222 RepID=UPI00165DE22A|nr:hemerythrin domain-containing protein [Terrabacter sp. MAHUQ-38]MBC9820647.1 hemerythrin domain-containing protein [Terrabacter sp. MAHUQ-38]
MTVQPNAAIQPLDPGQLDQHEVDEHQAERVREQGAAQLAAHLDRVRRHRSELRESVAAVDLALESPIARGGMWRERVRAALAELAHDFDDHVALTESSGGIYDRARRSAPRLSARVDRLLREHRELREAIHGYLAVLEHGGTMADLPVFREELTVLMGRLVRHRQKGGDLVYEAYDVDLGGSG